MEKRRPKKLLTTWQCLNYKKSSQQLPSCVFGTRDASDVSTKVLVLSRRESVLITSIWRVPDEFSGIFEITQLSQTSLLRLFPTHASKPLGSQGRLRRRQTARLRPVFFTRKSVSESIWAAKSRELGGREWTCLQVEVDFLCFLRQKQARERELGPTTGTGNEKRRTLPETV